jgi:bifunctional non-homologous end joining protein LigD
MGIVKAVELFFQEGNSDKLYTAAIVEEAGAYTVRVQWGRRGSSLNSGNKAVRVSLESAHKTFDKLVREKTGKGYQAITTASKPAAVAPPEGEGSGSKVQGRRAKVGLAAQLLTAIEQDELEAFLADDAVLAQQKLDGTRVLAHVTAEGVLATNRDGQKTASVSVDVLEGLTHLPEGTVVDGEVLSGDEGPEYWLFDVLRFGERDVAALGYEARWRLLEEELEPALFGAIRVLPIAVGAQKKRALHTRLSASRAEGLVFKQRTAPYTPGRPSSGGTQRKFKYVKSADVVLLSNAGNAYLMAVYDGAKLFEVGKVFAGTTNDSRKRLDGLLGRGEQPVAEVQYLYATDDEQLFQPVFVRLRDDKAPKQCLRSQLAKTNRDVHA